MSRFHWLSIDFTANTFSGKIAEIHLPNGPSKGTIPRCVHTYVQ